MARTGERIEQVMLAQYVTHILAQKALDALPEFLHALDVCLRHAPCAIGRIGRPWLERRYVFLDAEIP